MNNSIRKQHTCCLRTTPISYIVVKIQRCISLMLFCFFFLLQSEDLFQLIESHEGKLLKLYVYNSETDGCREVCPLYLQVVM